jgi:hypothetical protein
MVDKRCDYGAKLEIMTTPKNGSHTNHRRIFYLRNAYAWEALRQGDRPPYSGNVLTGHLPVYYE